MIRTLKPAMALVAMSKTSGCSRPVGAAKQNGLVPSDFERPPGAGINGTTFAAQSAMYPCFAAQVGNGAAAMKCPDRWMPAVAIPRSAARSTHQRIAWNEAATPQPPSPSSTNEDSVSLTTVIFGAGFSAPLLSHLWTSPMNQTP